MRSYAVTYHCQQKRDCFIGHGIELVDKLEADAGLGVREEGNVGSFREKLVLGEE